MRSIVEHFDFAEFKQVVFTVVGGSHNRLIVNSQWGQ